MELNLTPERRRTVTLALLGVGALAFLLALVPTLLALPNASAFLAVSAALLGLALIGELVVFLWNETETQEFTDLGEWTEEDEALPQAEPAQELLLRCKNCSEVFPVVDDGSRPLRHSCPSCGNSGILKDVPAAQ